jgi:hypothetical protein
MAIKQINPYPTITPGEYDERTGRYENVGIDDTGWNWDENTGKTTKIDPNFQAPSQFSLEDIKNRSGYAFDPNQDKLVSDFRDESLDPDAYYTKLAKDLSEASYGIWSINGDPSQYTDLIESLKEVDPKAYYTAKIDTLSRGIGHQYQSNQMDRGDIVKQQLQDLIPEAQKAGLTPEEINSIYGSGYSAGAQGFAQILQNQQSQGGPYTPLWEGIKLIGPALIGAYGLETLGAAGAAGAGAVDSTAVALGGAGGGGAFIPSAGASFSLAPGAAYTTAGLTSLGEGALSTADILASTGFTPTSGSSFVIDPTATYTTASAANPLTTTEILKSTGFEPSSGIDFNIDPNATYTTSGAGYGGDAQYETQGMEEQARNTNVPSGSETSWDRGVSALPTELTAAEKLAKALKKGAELLTKKSGGTSPADSLFGGDGFSIPGIKGSYIKLNENPFTFGNQSPLTASAYDVSGGNSMANALRKRT